MEYNVRKAKKSEFEAVRQLYWEVIDHPSNHGWVKGDYPSDEMIATAIANGEMYVLITGDEMSGAMILNHNCTDGYEKVTWQTKAAPDEVMVIHALTVHPQFSRMGLAKALVSKAFEIARSNNCKAIHLDVIEHNVAAQTLYQAMGFHICGEIRLYYSCVGEKTFIMMEYPL